MVRIILTLLIAWACAHMPAGSTELVKVGAYPFLPFVDKSGGLTADLLQAMNTFQTDYRFQLVNTSPNRRYRDMADGTFNVIFFENIKWGWDARLVDASKVFLQGDGEVYVALKQPGRGQEYFKTLEDKHILGVTGYHYGFADFEADPSVLAHKFHMTFSPDNEVSLRNLLAERGDVAVITKSYLNSYQAKDPQALSKLLVSDRLDQIYAHTVLVKKGSKPTAQDIEALLDKMEAAGVLKKLWARYGLEN